jgi:hypothetical protein
VPSASTQLSGATASGAPRKPQLLRERAQSRRRLRLGHDQNEPAFFRTLLRISRPINDRDVGDVANTINTYVHSFSSSEMPVIDGSRNHL